MIDRGLALSALKDILAFTTDIEGLIRIWPKRQISERRRIEPYQKRNERVFLLFEQVADPAKWGERLEQEIVHFLLEESSLNGLMGKKLGCLYAAGLPHASLDLTYRSVLDALLEIRTVPFLLSEMRAFNALGQGAYSVYQSVIVPVEEAFSDTITTIRFGKSDTLLAIPKSLESKERLIAFAEALLNRIVECRRTQGLSSVVNLGISVARGDCKFELLTGEPVPDSLDSDAPTWYQAAKLLAKAEKVSGYQKQRGGAILMTDEANGWFGNICKRRRMSEFDRTLKKEDDHEFNIFDGFGRKAQGS